MKRLLMKRARIGQGFTLVEVMAGAVISVLFALGIFPLMAQSAIRLRKNERTSVAATLIQQDLERVKALASDPAQYLTSYVTGTPNTCDPVSAPYADDLNIALGLVSNSAVQGSDADYVLTRVSQLGPSGDDVVEVTYTVTFQGDVVLDDVSSEVLPSALYLCP